MTPDCESLRLYAEQGNQAAFALVVRQHMNWVYSTALRLTAGDAHLAEDVTQVVFSDLARKAGRLWRHPALGGWLHTAVRFAAAKAVTRESARRVREQEAFAMQNQPTTTEISWERLQPVLDDGIGRLGEADRNIVVLRFFEGKSHRELGDMLGLSEDTARKRVERAVEKLRDHFSRKGITVSAGLLAEAVTANAVSTAPTGLAEGLTSTALSNAAAAPTGLGVLAKIFITMTTPTKIILGAVAVVVAAVSYQYATQTKTAEPTLPAAANAASAAPVQRVPAQVVLPKQAPMAVTAAASEAMPISSTPPPEVAPTLANTDANVQAAMTMMASMKQTFGEVYSSLMETNDMDGALEKINTLSAQLDVLQARVVGTPLQQQLTPAANAIRAAQTALQHGDVTEARKVLEKLNAGGPNIQKKIETTAGKTFDQAAKDISATPIPDAKQ